MENEEEPSWLSSLIDQADRLILAIGGYGQESFEHEFSDDESDGGQDEDESEIEEAGTHIQTARHQAGEQVSSEEEDAMPSSEEAVIAADGPKLAARNLVLDSVDVVDNKDGAHDQVQKEVYPELEVVVSGVDEVHDQLWATPSRSRGHEGLDDDGRRVMGVASPGQEAFVPSAEGANARGAVGDAYELMLRTPCHDRDRDGLKRTPPQIGVLPGGGVMSRRIYRDKNRRTASGENEGGGLSLASSVDGGPAEGVIHPSLSPSAANLKKKNLSTGKTGKKRFSYVGDTTWLRPRDESPETTPAPQALRPGLAAEAWTPIPVTRLSTSTEESRDSDSGNKSTGAFVPPLTAKGGGRQSPSEMEKQLDQDMVAAAYPEVDTDSDVGRLSVDSLDVPAEDEDIDAEKLPEFGAAECPVEERSASAGLDVAIREQVYASGGDAHEERGAEPERAEEGQADHAGAQMEGGQHPGTGEDGTATIGAKRTSTENGMGAHEYAAEDWVLDAPDAFAPAKRGKTQLEYPLAVMRHSSRLDDAIHERQRKRETNVVGNVGEGSSPPKESGNGGKGSLQNGHSDDLTAVPWPDMAHRPYDSPIVDTDLPARQAKELSHLGFGSQTLIMCSPFRRCLQTAGVVARTLGVARVTVNLQIGERMDKVRKEIAELELVNGQHPDREANKQPVPVFSYLNESDMLEALGAGVHLEGVVGEQPLEEESGVEAKERFIATIAQVREEQLRESPVLVVAHGDTLDAAGESLASQIIFEADYCAWAVFDLDAHCGYVTQSYGIQMIPL